MHGIENICCLTGDDVTAGDEPEARRVFDLDGAQLVSIVALARSAGATCRAADLAPRPTSSPARSRTRARRRSTYRVRRAAKKALAGARFLQLQICYRTRAARALHARGARDRR